MCGLAPAGRPGGLKRASALTRDLQQYWITHPVVSNARPLCVCAVSNPQARLVACHALRALGEEEGRLGRVITLKQVLGTGALEGMVIISRAGSSSEVGPRGAEGGTHGGSDCLFPPNSSRAAAAHRLVPMHVGVAAASAPGIHANQ